MIEVSNTQDLTPDQIKAALNWGFSMQDYGTYIPDDADPIQWVDDNFSSTALELVNMLKEQYKIQKFIFNKYGYFVTEDNQWGN